VRSSLRRAAVPVAVALSLGLVGAGCSKSNTTSTGSGGSTPGTSAATPTGDYSSLSGTLNGSGATFPQPFYEEAISQLKDLAPKLTVNYGGGGSGKGKQELADKVVDFAGSDSLVKEEDKAKYKGGTFLYFPTVAAPITVSYNVSGVSKLQLTPSTLGKIFSGKVTTWNDPAITADNSGVTLPSAPIKVVHRSDGSGTTSNFTKYLKAAAGSDWTLDAGDTVNWPADTQGANGNAGVAQGIKGTANSIGYVDYSDAKATGLTFASIKNKDGQFVAPTLEGASAALANAEVKDDLTYSALNTAGAQAYPITAGTYIIVYEKQTDATVGKNVKGWLTYLLTDGQAQAASVDFAKLPDSMQAKAVAQISKIQVP
jgi:phosphate transport system substrate-binding protein